ncbi:thiamine kinase [Nocardia farcinica]|uniref:Thiamine kinase n=1 Tax=Nocardia farcinica TaxID=37329 RepID=A0A449HBC4_NOCFR|nr:thiamine kinase [Nocardia farcinica]
MERRDFVTLATAAALGSRLHPELERLAALLPDARAAATRTRVGAADVAAIGACGPRTTPAPPTRRRHGNQPTTPGLAHHRGLYPGRRLLVLLDPDDREWLRCRAADLVARFDATHFPLGRGLVHADAHTENVVRDGADWKLIDWDNACSGPRELDLAATLPDHFHTPAADRTEFVTAYGYDPLEWPDWTVLRDIVELGSLGSYIRLAPTRPPAAHELRRRLASLRTGDRGVVWKPVG